ncbi:ATP-grasp domain-containing protein [Alkalicoccus chagannorensis]|uniref:ATP-grasp domain-containing protein n=1 Tax=Alkalicoccus chagannorensis TaxID=427072 RepID=UPI0004790A8B|nr:RimK family alpha-L-glutamate ligase [Alkalicoccus chagannorensis]
MLQAIVLYNGGLQTPKFMDNVALLQEAARRKKVHMTAVPNDALAAAPGCSRSVVGLDHHPDFLCSFDKDIELLEAVEQLGIPVFNSAAAIALCDNKRRMHQAFARHGIPQPKTILAPMAYAGVGRTDDAYLQEVERILGFPMIVKEAYGSFGKQVYWIASSEELRLKAADLQEVPHLYQEAVSDSLGTDLRLNVVGGQVSASMKRTSSTDFRANITAGGKAVPYEPTPEEKNTAIAAAAAVGADFAGVDLFAGRVPLVCEVNANPHIKSTYETTGIRVEDAMIDYMIRRTIRQ